MPDISLLDPLVLNGVVSKFTTPQTLLLLNSLPSSPSDTPNSVTWDVLKGSRQVATFNIPNAEAQILDRLGHSQESAKLAYVRVKKVFSPTSLHWLREPGQIAATNAEFYVTRELQDMSQAIDLLQEQALWGALRGSLTYLLPDGAATTVDYKFPASHLVSSGTVWTTATPVQLVNDIVAWKRLVTTHGRVKPTTAYCSTLTVQKIFNSFAGNAGASILTTGGAFPMGTMLSDRMKDAYYNNAMIPGFCGLDWYEVEEVYTDSNGLLQRFVGDGSSSNAEVFIGNYSDNRPVETKYGKSADDDAPEGLYGKFTKTWKEHDPSQRQVLMELSFLPVVTRPEQFIYCANVG